MNSATFWKCQKKLCRIDTGIFPCSRVTTGSSASSGMGTWYYPSYHLLYGSFQLPKSNPRLTRLIFCKVSVLATYQIDIYQAVTSRLVKIPINSIRLKSPVLKQAFHYPYLSEAHCHLDLRSDQSHILENEPIVKSVRCDWGSIRNGRSNMPSVGRKRGRCDMCR